jgi:hypothetical protein
MPPVRALLDTFRYKRAFPASAELVGIDINPMSFCGCPDEGAKGVDVETIPGGRLGAAVSTGRSGAAGADAAGSCTAVEPVVSGLTEVVVAPPAAGTSTDGRVSPVTGSSSAAAGASARGVVSPVTGS